MFKLNFISYGRAVRRSRMAGWCNGSTSLSECEAAGSNPDPATKMDITSVILAVKGGGEVKMKQRCLLKRFAALVAALVICSSLCIPAFASNNASSQKWVITSETQMRTESGVIGKYFQVTPYVGGDIYATNIESAWGVSDSFSGSTWVFPINFPDWWRSAIPLGGYSYIAIDNVHVTYPTDFSSDVRFFLFDSTYSFDLSLDSPLASNSSNVSSTYPASGFSLTSRVAAYPVSGYYYTAGGGGGSIGTVPYIRSSQGGSSTTTLIQSLQQIGLSIVEPLFSDSSSSTQGLITCNRFYNLSSDNLIIAVAPINFSSTAVRRIACTAEISFFIDANKLPSGLKVGDEFPADTDAFDKLRDDLIDQFPEASDNIQNGKDTIQGWNDTETVDTDVASTSISALNAMFQNLGGFLFIISLMVFGAVVLRMLIRKAVDG